MSRLIALSKTSARVIADYQAPYPDPISGRAGDRVVLDDSRKTDLRGWAWATNASGKGGWVPKNYLERHGGIGVLRCDYDAIELTVRAGEMLTCHKEESGFIWATNQAGQEGWVPVTHVDLISK